MKKILILPIIILLFLTLSSCGEKDTASVYFFNFKPEADRVMQEIARIYQSETGVNVKVSTAASGNYESTLETEIIKKEAPTIFTINGPVGYENWKRYTLDLSDTKLFSEMLAENGKALAVYDSDMVVGIPVTVEGIGLVYNKDIFTEYFSLSNRTTSISSVDEIKSYSDLRAVVLDMEDKKDVLGIDGVFATSMKAGSQWPYQTHLVNIPLFFEFKGEDTSSIVTALEAKELNFTHSSELQNMIDLYFDNSVTKRNELDATDYDSAKAQFAQGKAAIIQQGNWVYSDLINIDKTIINENNIGMMPIYMGIDGEENYSIAVGTENYWCVNKRASSVDQEASIAFLEWLFSSEEGKKYVVDELGFIAPFNTFTEEEEPSNPLAKDVLGYISDDSKKTIDWTFNSIPSEDWKNILGQALVDYAKGSKTWEEVVVSAKNSWRTQRA